MPVRHKKIIKHTAAQKAHLRAVKRRSGPSALRRKERRIHLQPKPLVPEEV